MGILEYILLAVLIVVCFMLIMLVLVQKTKSGGGLGTAFGGGGNDSILGSRAGNVLTKATIVLGLIFVIDTLCLAVIFNGKQEKLVMDRDALNAAAQQAAASRGIPAPQANKPEVDLSTVSELPVSAEATVAPVTEKPVAPIAEEPVAPPAE